jgi:hypothetical protein
VVPLGDLYVSWTPGEEQPGEEQAGQEPPERESSTQKADE